MNFVRLLRHARSATSLNPKPQTLNPKPPQTPNPKPQISKPETRNPKPYSSEAARGPPGLQGLEYHSVANVRYSDHKPVQNPKPQTLNPKP